MRTTLNIDEGLLERAMEMTGVTEKTRLVHLGLEMLVQRKAAERLADMEGTDLRAASGTRRKSLGRVR
jgi:Arc/MetJ family transcription regulator